MPVKVLSDLEPPKFPYIYSPDFSIPTNLLTLNSKTAGTKTQTFFVVLWRSYFDPLGKGASIVDTKVVLTDWRWFEPGSEHCKGSLTGAFAF